jgi:predicted AAA+ superfamily ATPase
VLYLSADNPLIAIKGLWEIGNTAFLAGYDGIIVDEVHYAKDWSSALKSLYDAFPDKSVYASDSSSFILRSGIADLSRRFSSVQIPQLSFREYLFLKKESICRYSILFNRTLGLRERLLIQSMC